MTFNEIVEEIAAQNAAKFGMALEDALSFYDKLGTRPETHLLVVYREPYENSVGHYIYKDVIYNTINHKARLTVRTNWAGEEIDRKVTKLEKKQRAAEEFYREAIQVIYPGY